MGIQLSSYRYDCETGEGEFVELDADELASIAALQAEAAAMRKEREAATADRLALVEQLVAGTAATVDVQAALAQVLGADTDLTPL